jgi:hypothetical protein
MLNQVHSANFRVGLNLGHNGGLGWDLYGTAFNFAQGLPLAMKLNLGYTYLDPGQANDARMIFINNNQGGTIEKKGTILRFGLDFLYGFKFKSIPEAFVYFGPRHASFKGNFKFIGDNEDFDVTSTHWGFGLGLETGFPISGKINFMLNGGIENYFPSKLTGHDTSYGPNGEKVNPREDYEYKDADEAINQPKLEFKIMIGLSYKFGK